MNSQRLAALLAKISSLRIAIIGDYALDFYFKLAAQSEEISLETDKTVQHASEAKTHLGGAGNVAKNLACLGVQVDAFGIRGNDIFGREMDFLANQAQINTKQLHTKSGIDTPTYSKPMVGDLEQSRIDFGTRNERIQEFSLDVIHEMAIHANDYDWVIINQQFQNPLLNQATLEYLQKFIGGNSIADLRSLGKYATQILLKVNESELTKLIGATQDWENKIKQWVARREKPVLVTLGEKGMIYASPTEFHWEKAIPKQGPIDTVGAGDMIVAAFSAARAAGASTPESCQFASLAAHVSIHKLGETGSANPQEIIQTNHATRN